MLVVMLFLAFVAASRWPSAIAHCFKTLGFAGVLGSACLVSILLNFSAEMYAGSLASGC